jgi:hypothetical protein
MTCLLEGGAAHWREMNFTQLAPEPPLAKGKVHGGGLHGIIARAMEPAAADKSQQKIPLLSIDLDELSHPCPRASQ